MRTTTLLSAFALGAGLVAGGASLAPAFAGDSRPASISERQWLSIPQIHDKLVGAGYHNIEKIEREDGAYEARATDRNGERVKLYLNPQTGEFIDRQQRQFIAIGLCEFQDTIIEALDHHLAISIVKSGCQLRHHLHRVRHIGAVSTRVHIGVGSGEVHLEASEALQRY